MLNRLLISLSIFCLFVSCGDECSSNSSTQPEFVESSSSFEQDIESSSVKKFSSSEAKSSSVAKASSSSTKQIRASSSSVKGTSSSRKTESSSSQGSSSVKDDKSSSSGKSSSSEKEEDLSSSENMSSSSEKKHEPLSSVESSSTELFSSSSEESSSSEMPSLSSEYSSSSVSSSSALNSIYDAENNTLTDLRDNHVYKTVTIGSQVWMAQNIDYLPEDTVGTKYGGNTVCGGGEPGTFKEGDCSIHGRLYTRAILIDSIGDGRVICPDGWIIPAASHWLLLIEALGGESVAGAKMKLDDNLMWGENMTHSNASGFSATLASFYSVIEGFNPAPPSVKNKRTSMLVYPVNKSAYSQEMNSKTIYDDEDSLTDHGYNGPQYAISVRCIKK